MDIIKTDVQFTILEIKIYYLKHKFPQLLAIASNMRHLLLTRKVAEWSFCLTKQTKNFGIWF